MRSSRMRSGAAYRTIGAGDANFAAAAQAVAAPQCPAGMHDDGTGAGPIGALGKCVPNAPAAAAPAPTLPAAATATLTCPALWPWWWLVVAAGVGAAAGYYGERNRKKVRQNAGRFAARAGGRIVQNASGAVLSRVLY
jgi:hypothetical protein